MLFVEATQSRRLFHGASNLYLMHLHRDWAYPYHICTETGLTPATSASRPGSSLPHLDRDSARAATSAPRPGSPRPHLHRDRSRRVLHMVLPHAAVPRMVDQASYARSCPDHRHGRLRVRCAPSSLPLQQRCSSRSPHSLAVMPLAKQRHGVHAYPARLITTNQCESWGWAGRTGRTAC
jgi:hypothetical protein